MDVNLQSSDGVTYTLPKDAVTWSSLLEDICEHCSNGENNVTVPLPKVPDVALGPVVEWMRRKTQVCAELSNTSPQCIQSNQGDYYGREFVLLNWERAFFHHLNKDVLFMVLNAASYMGIAALVAAGTTYIAEMVKGMTVEEARVYLNSTSSTTKMEGIPESVPGLDSDA
ncbi:hypothetical protein KIN20_009219 [Parelaphostrongylus tenuis]|uniref:Skp1-related protein n=1 Tax=Parelaphostrongylus tenuis TaxID=148309 RepID=A0AAD5QJG9_PARTN|nr:hypothetical protein KIN20_009219 [Parelaphostrongylus tenuis]